MNIDGLPEILMPSEVADYLRISRATVYEMIRTGKLRAVRAGAGRQGGARVPKSALIDFVMGYRPPAQGT